MITVSVKGRKAVLLKTADLPSGNESSIKVNFIFSESDEIWDKARKFAIFHAVTPKGLAKRLPAVIDRNDECYIPGKIIVTPNSMVSVSVTAVFEDGASVSTNDVFVNKTIGGAGGIYDEEIPVEKSDFESFLADLSAGIGTQFEDLQAKFKEHETTLKALAIDFNGNLKVNDEAIIDYSQFFHIMSRQSPFFKVDSYWDLLEYDASEERTDPETGEKCTWVKYIDLRPGTRDGDSVFTQMAVGNVLRQSQVPDLIDFLPELEIVYPVIHFWQWKLPEPDDGEEHSESFAVFSTLHGEEYKISRYFSSIYGVWVVELTISSIEGSWIYSWEDTDILRKDTYLYIKNGSVIEHWDDEYPLENWPVATDVKCIELQNKENLFYLLFNYFPRNYHPAGRYVYDGKREKWTLSEKDMTSKTFTITKDGWGWDNRKTLIIGGCVPSNEITISKSDGEKINFSVVNISYNHITIEAPEPITEDVQVVITMKNTVERNDTFGTWEDY